MCFSSNKRNGLIRKLASIQPHNFNRLVFILGGLNRLNLESSMLPPTTESLWRRANGLVEWAVTLEGCGLKALDYSLNCILEELELIDEDLDKLTRIKRLNDLDEEQFSIVLQNCHHRLEMPTTIIFSSAIPREIRAHRLMEWADKIHEVYVLRCIDYFIERIFLNQEITDEDLESLGFLSNSTINAETTNLLIEVLERGVIRVFDIDQGWIILPQVLPGTIEETSIEIIANREYVWSWKRVHALTEKLYPEYIKLLHDMQFAQGAVDFGNVPMSRRLVSDVARHFKEEYPYTGLDNGYNSLGRFGGRQ